MNETILQIRDIATEYNSNDGVEELFRTPSNIAYIVVCSVIVILNIFLNATYIYLYNKTRVPTTNFNLCLAHYSTSTVFGYTGLFPYLWIDVTKISTTDSMAQRLLCGIVLEGLYIPFWGGVVNAFMLTFMAVTRCLCIKYPFSEILTKKKIHRFAALFWLIGCILMTPNVIPWKMSRKHGLCVRTKEFGRNINFAYLFTITVLIMLGPPIIMVICLIIIVLHTFKKLDVVTNQATIRHRKSIVKSLVCLIVIFLICGFGFFLYNLLSYIGYFSKGWAGVYQKYKFVQYAFIPLVLEGALNVVVYNLANKKIRDAYLKLFKEMRIIILCNPNTS